MRMGYYKYSAMVFGILLVIVSASTGCKRQQNAYNNDKMSTLTVTATAEAISQSTLQPSSKSTDVVTKGTSTYECDFDKDRDDYDGNVDITVGDNYFATQINDWYMYFEQYEGKVVEIEGYYIGEFAPYDFVGRYGPTCPYCNGGYPSFEILSEQDLSGYRSFKDWIKVDGILRQGVDSDNGPFYYIEVLKIQKMKKAGKETVNN